MDKENTAHTQWDATRSYKRMTFTATWMALEVIIPSDVCQTKTNTI